MKTVKFIAAILVAFALLLSCEKTVNDPVSKPLPAMGYTYTILCGNCEMVTFEAPESSFVAEWVDVRGNTNRVPVDKGYSLPNIQVIKGSAKGGPFKILH